MSAALEVVAMTPLAAMDLITLSPAKFIAEVYAPFHRRLALGIDELREVKYDITTTAGMKVAVECRAVFRRLRLDVEGARKERKAPILTIGDLLDAGGNAIKAQILPLEALFDDQITEEGARKAAAKLAAENAAIAQALAVNDAIGELRQCELEAVRTCTTAAETQAAIDALEAREINAAVYFERQAEAELIKAETLAAMRALYGARAKAEADTAIDAAKRVADDLRLAEDTARVAAAMAEVAVQRKANEEAARLQAIAAADLAKLQAEFAATIQTQKDENARVAATAAAETRRLALADTERVAAADLLAQQAAVPTAIAEPAPAPRADPMDAYGASIQESMSRSGLGLSGRRYAPPMSAATLAARAAIDAALSPTGLATTPIVAPALPPIDADIAPAAELDDDHISQMTLAGLPGPSDLEILQLVMATFHMTRSVALARMARFDCLGLVDHGSKTV